LAGRTDVAETGAFARLNIRLRQSGRARRALFLRVWNRRQTRKETVDHEAVNGKFLKISGFAGEKHRRSESLSLRSAAFPIAGDAATGQVNAR
jgi:hypothetical protein